MAISPFALVKRFASEKRGASFVEYAMLTGIVAALVVVALNVFGADVGNLFGRIGAQLDATTPTTVTQTNPTVN